MQLLRAIAACLLFSASESISASQSDAGASYRRRDSTSTPSLHGFSIDHQTCNPRQGRALTRSCGLFQDFVQAALDVLNSTGVPQDQALFEYFFRPEDKSAVLATMNNVLDIIDRGSPTSLDFDCTNPECNVNEAYANAFYEASQDANGTPSSGNSDSSNRNNNFTVSFCPRFFRLRALPRPCDEKYLQNSTTAAAVYTTVTTVMQELLHIPYIAGADIKNTADFATNAVSAHVLVDPDQHGLHRNSSSSNFGGGSSSSTSSTAESAGSVMYTPRENVGNYVLFTTWAWMRQEQQGQCPKAYPLWHILDQVESSSGNSSNAASDAASNAANGG